ncbi:MAG TPA: hypothetical protein PKW49_07535 [Paludibacteraceae bacterium]|nr:hypothetical protein [Paludibacteraceae bacterium]HQJ90318.1 hypothetical protein [Paludibacteraceae bacterium]
MKAKTKLQKQVVKLSEELPLMTTTQQKWAYKHIIIGQAYMSKNQCWCSECGKTFDNPSAKKTTICPHCGNKLEIEKTRRLGITEAFYYTIITTFKGFQVLRHFMIERTSKKGQKSLFEAKECVQNWINEDGKETIIARSVRPMSPYYDAWDFNSKMELKINRATYSNMNRYYVFTKYIMIIRNTD